MASRDCNGGLPKVNIVPVHNFCSLHSHFTGSTLTQKRIEWISSLHKPKPARCWWRSGKLIVFFPLFCGPHAFLGERDWNQALSLFLWITESFYYISLKKAQKWKSRVNNEVWRKSQHRISDLKMLSGVDYYFCFEFDYPLRLPRRECLQHSGHCWN